MLDLTVRQTVSLSKEAHCTCNEEIVSIKEGEMDVVDKLYGQSVLNSTQYAVQQQPRSVH